MVNIPSRQAHWHVISSWEQSLFLSAIYFTLHETTTWAKTNYLTETPILVTSIALMTLCAYGAYKGIRSLAFTAGLILPLVVLLGFYVAIVNTQYKDYSRLLPVLEHGWHPVLNGMIYSLAGMFELLFIWYIQPHLTKRIRVWQYLMLALVLVGLTVGPLIGAIVEFDPLKLPKCDIPPLKNGESPPWANTSPRPTSFPSTSGSQARSPGLVSPCIL